MKFFFWKELDRGEKVNYRKLLLVTLAIQQGLTEVYLPPAMY